MKVIINCGKSDILKSKQVVSLAKRISNKFFQCPQTSPPASTRSLQLPFVIHCLRPAFLYYRLITGLIIFWVTFCFSRLHIVLSFTGISLKFNFVVYNCKDWTSICSFPRKTFPFNPGWRENCDCMTLFICWLASLH